MAEKDRGARGGSLVSWLVLVLWVCVIWGHSLLSGPISSTESGFFMDLMRRALVFLHLDRLSIVSRLIDDPQLFHHVVRKGAHFSEYFVLGLLTFNALRRSFTSLLLCGLALVAIGAGVPGIDEFIQRFTPERAGQLRDVLLDMSGFACAMVLCLLAMLLFPRRR